MAFAFSIPYRFINPNNSNNKSNLTFKLKNESKLHFQNPRNQSQLPLSSTNSYSPMRSYSSIPNNAYGFGINYRKTVRIRNPNFVVRSSSSESQAPVISNSTIIFWSAVTLVLAVGNRVLYKLALVPMKEYPFFLAQVNTFG